MSQNKGQKGKKGSGMAMGRRAFMLEVWCQSSWVSSGWHGCWSVAHNQCVLLHMVFLGESVVLKGFRAMLETLTSGILKDATTQKLAVPSPPDSCNKPCS